LSIAQQALNTPGLHIGQSFLDRLGGIDPATTNTGGGRGTKVLNVEVNTYGSSFEAEETIGKAIRNIADRGGFDDIF